MSFFIISNLWITHHYTFGFVGHVTKRLIRLNFFWLAGIVFFPVTTSLMEQAPVDDRTRVGVYYGVLLAIDFINLMMCIAIRSDDKTWKEDRPPGLLIVARTVVFIFLLIAALILALLKPSVKTFGLLLLLAADPVMFVVQKMKPLWTY